MRIGWAGSRHESAVAQAWPILIGSLRTLCALAFVFQFTLLELWIRPTTFFTNEPRHIASVLASVALLSLIVRSPLVRTGWARALLATWAGGVLMLQMAYYRYYHAPLDAQAAIAARHAWADVRAVLERTGTEVVITALGVLLLEYCLLPRAVSPGNALESLSLAGAVAAGLIFTGHVHGMTTEFRTAHAAFTLLTTRDRSSKDGRLPLPELESSRPELPNVLLIITESVRAADACLRPACVTSPEFDRLLPSRTNFEQARAVSSYTAVALSALSTGQFQLGPRLGLSRAPDFFDLAHAVRANGMAYTLAYWSSQLAGVFERGPINQVSNQVITAEVLLHGPAADIEDSVAALLDRRLADVCERQMDQLRGPRFVVLHLSGTHAPYAFEDDRAVLRPWQRQVTWAGLPALHRAYLNSIIEQDRSIGRCIDAFLRQAGGQPWVVFYTSDHGEAFGEHSAIHHGQNLYDEQIRVPLVIAHGGGALSAEQSRQLEQNRTGPVTHLDLLPTLLDIMGLNRHIALQRWADKLPGRSLLRPLGKLGAIPITNCTELFPCPINTWGVLGERTKLTAQGWDGQWRCMSLNGTEHEIELDACRELRSAACGYFGLLPNSRSDPFCVRNR